MSTKTLTAYANGGRVGTLMDENGIWSFEYDADWASSSSAFPLSPAFPLDARERVVDDSSSRPVQWFFDNLLPEERMRDVLAREAKLDANDAWGLLAYYGRESAGALTLLPQGEREAPGRRVPLSFDELQARIQAMPRHALTANAPKRMSAAGAQQKLLVILAGREQAYALFEPDGAEPSMHLLKPDMRIYDYPHSAINEFFCMRLAGKLGLQVPPTHLLRVPTACYVVDRFDRDTRTTPASRIHTLDAVQLLNKDKAFKYHNATAESLRRCIEQLGTRAQARLAIFRWSIFNIMIGNADAHLKNLSFFSKPGGYELAPFYDLVSTVVYNTPTYRDFGERWPACELSMPIGNARHFAELTRDDVLIFGEQLGMSKTGAARDLDSMLAAFKGKVAEARAETDAIANVDAGETRLLDLIERLPIAEMGRALK
jgi:HipA-like protein